MGGRSATVGVYVGMLAFFPGYKHVNILMVMDIVLVASVQLFSHVMQTDSGFSHK